MQVFSTREFDKRARKLLSRAQQKELETFLFRIGQDDQRAKHLRGNWLYEINLQEKRVYCVSDGIALLCVDVSHKDEQEDVIEVIVEQKRMWLTVLSQYATS